MFSIAFRNIIFILLIITTSAFRIKLHQETPRLPNSESNVRENLVSPQILARIGFAYLVSCLCKCLNTSIAEMGV